MLLKRMSNYFGITLLWLLAISFFHFNFRLDIVEQLVGLVPFWLGGLFGVIFPDFDQLTYCFITYPEEFTSLRVKRLFQQKKIKEALSLISGTSGERMRLTAHNILFQVVLIVLCFFVVTSTNSSLGKGIVMGMFLHLLVDEFEFIRRGEFESFKKLFFWPLKKEVTLDFQRYFVIISSVIFVLLSLFLIR